MADPFGRDFGIGSHPVLQVDPATALQAPGSQAAVGPTPKQLPKPPKETRVLEGESALSPQYREPEAPVVYGDPRLRGSFNPRDNVPLTYNGKEPAQWSPQDYKEVGEIAGVQNLGPDSPPVTYKYEDGSTFHIPGGTAGTFTLYDLYSMKAQGIDPSRIALPLHAAIQQKMLRTMTPAELTNEHVWDGLVFGLTSPNNPLFPNQLAQSRLRLRDPAMLDEIAGMIPWPAGAKVPKEQRAEYSNRIAETFGLQAAPEGLGVRGSQDYTRIAELAQMFKSNPQFFRKRADEGWDQFVEKIASQVGGLKMKTASLGTVWQDPGLAAVSAIDRHMASMFERQGGLFKDELDRMQWEQGAVARWNSNEAQRQVPDFYTLRKTPGTDGHIGAMLLEYVGKTNPMVFRMARSGQINPDAPPHLAQAQWAVEPKKIEIMGERYKRALDLNNQLAQENGLNLFGSQWMFWDRRRRRLEPHENMFPGLERMPAMSLEQLRQVSQEHTLSGHKTYTKLDPATGKPMRNLTEEQAEGVDFVLQPTKKRLNPSAFGYFALPLVVGAGAMALHAGAQGGEEQERSY